MTDFDADEKKGPPWESEAAALLDRMNTDPEAVRQYAELAEREGFSCYGMAWRQWAGEVLGETVAV